MSDETNTNEVIDEIIDEVDDRELEREARRREREAEREARRLEREAEREARRQGRDKQEEKTYYFNIHKGDLVTTFHMKESEAREKYGDFEADEEGNVIIYENEDNGTENTAEE